MHKSQYNKKGFTLVELVVVAAVIVVLSAIAVPTFTGIVGRSEEAVCVSNRSSLYRLYQYRNAIDQSCTLEAFMAGEYDDISQYICPAGGVYSIVDGQIVCSIHSEGETGDPGGTGGTGGTSGTGGTGGTSGTEPSSDGYSSGDLAFTDPNGLRVYLSGTWSATKTIAADVNNSDWGALLTNGTVYRDDSGIYVVVYSPWLSRSEAASDPLLSQYSQVTSLRKLNPSAVILTDSDYDYSNNRWINPPVTGSLYKHNGYLYVLASPSSGIWTTNDVTAGDWIRLLGN